ncbi:glycosyltransferase [bacterium]|nr:glycosyltransferase [bacterium]
MNSNATIIAAANPSFYPHLERHATAWLKKHETVNVFCCFPSDQALPQIKNIQWISIQPELPQGPRGFYQFMKKCFSRLKVQQSQVPVSQIEAIDPLALIPAALFILKQKISFKAKPKLMYFSMELYRKLPNLRKQFLKKNIWATLETLASSQADRVCTVSNGVASYLTDMLRKKNIETVRSCPPLIEAVESFNIQEHLKIDSKSKILIYQGLIEEGRGIDELCKAITEKLNWHLVALGDGPALPFIKKEWGKNPKIHLQGRMPYKESLKWIQAADVGAVFIQSLSLSFHHCLPGKIFEYMQMNTPVLISPLPDLSHLLQLYPAGVRSNGFGVDHILQALNELEEDLKSDSYSATLIRAREDLNWEKESLKLIGDN